MDYEAYLAIERETDWRHEWFDGHVFVMAGGTLEHSALSGRMITELGLLATKCGCQVHTSDAKIRVLETGLVTYADVVVVCGTIERDPEDRNAMTNPALIVEVLSDGTAGYDRGEKFENYQRIPSLRDYVLVSQHKPRVEVYSRDAKNRWVLTVAVVGESERLTAMEGALEVDRIYVGIELIPAPPRAVTR